MQRNPLELAERLFQQKRWGSTIQLLEPLDAVYRENSRYLFLLGTAYLHAEDIGAAYSCFRRGRQLDFRNISILSGLAAVLIRRGETDKAVQIYIEILERDNRNLLAKRGLEFLRKHETEQLDFNKRLNGLLKKRLYPGPAFSLKPLVFSLLILAGLAFAYVLLAPRLQNRIGRFPERPEIVAVNLSAEDRAAPVGTAGSFRLVLTADEALATFERAKSLFNAYRDEAALVEINRILISNASAGLKAKAEIIRRHARPASFATMPDRFSLKQVTESVYLYTDVPVLWKGVPANVRKSGSNLRFDFLVGYQDARQLEGIVEVLVPFPFTILEGQALEILAYVKTDAVTNAPFYLECIAIHTLPANK